MSNHLQRILEVKRLQEQKRQEDLEKAERVQAAKDFIEQKDMEAIAAAVRSCGKTDMVAAMLQAETETEAEKAVTPDKPKSKRSRRKAGEPPRKSGRPRRPGKHLFLCLGFTAADGTRKLSTETWKTGAYGLKKALATLEWSREQTGADDFLVVLDPAVGSVSMEGLAKWPTALRGNPEIPTTLTGWLEWAQGNGLPNASISKEFTQ